MASAGFITSEQPRAVSSANSSPRDSRRSSAQSADKEVFSLKLVAKRTAAAIKKHHQEVNKAFDAVYGTKFYRN
jgi:hypothetical protein